MVTRAGKEVIVGHLLSMYCIWRDASVLKLMCPSVLCEVVAHSNNMFMFAERLSLLDAATVVVKVHITIFTLQVYKCSIVVACPNYGLINNRRIVYDRNTSSRTAETNATNALT